MNTTLEAPLETYEFTNSDRCDRCGAQAYVRATKGESELMFCAHHGKQHIPALVESKWSVLDLSSKLYTDGHP